MEAIVLLVGLGVIVFVATNVDDLFVLVAFFAEPRFRTHHIVIGQYLGICTLIAISALASLISFVISLVYVGLLGLVPIAIGATALWKQWLGQKFDLEVSGAGKRKILAVSAVTIANGGDNIATYTPLFAAHPAHDVAVLIAVFALMTAIWCFAARWLVRHPTLGAPIRRYGHRVFPFVMVGLGGLILYEAGSFNLLQNAARGL